MFRFVPEIKMTAIYAMLTLQEFLSVQISYMCHRDDTGLKHKTHGFSYLLGVTIRLILDLFWNERWL